MKTRLIFALLVCSCTIGFAQKSNVDFVIRNLGINVDGHFNTITITPSFDASNNLIKIEGTIDVSSIETGIESRNEHLLEEEYFNAAKHPSISLISTYITKQSANNYVVKADLKIKGKAKKINIPIKVTLTSSSRTLDSNFEINRKDFGVGGSSFVMSKTVKISVRHTEKL